MVLLSPKELTRMDVPVSRAYCLPEAMPVPRSSISLYDFGPVVARTLGRDGARCGDIEGSFLRPRWRQESWTRRARVEGTGEIVQIAAGVTPQAPVPVQVGETGQVFAAQNLEYVPLAKRLGPYPGLFHQVDFCFY